MCTYICIKFWQTIKDQCLHLHYLLSVMTLESSNVIYLFLGNIVSLLGNYSFGCLVSISLNIFPDTLQDFFIDITCHWKLISFSAGLDKMNTENLSDWKICTLTQLYLSSQLLNLVLNKAGAGVWVTRLGESNLSSLYSPVHTSLIGPSHIS